MALLVPAGAWAAPVGVRAVPLGFLGIELPSIQEIVEGIANGFAQALAGALVPGFLKHATVATIQWLVALPDPESWTHVRHLQGEMTWLGISLLPVTVTVGTVRGWVLGVSGAGDPAAILARAAGACGVLVAYPWVVSQVVDGANTVTHAILGFPEVANGLASLVTVLFGGALLVGAGSAFAAILVIVGVAFAGALFAIQAFLVQVLAFLIVGGPLAIALSPVPEMAGLARLWARALGVVVLVPVCWTVLFATAGALTLDATDVAGGAGGLPGHITAAFAALGTWALAVRLPMMLFGELRGFLAGGRRGGSGGGAGSVAGRMPGAERLRVAQARLRAVALEGVPAVTGGVGRAAGAMGAPAGGPAGALRRRVAVTRGQAPAGGAAPSAGGGGADPGGWRERAGRAREIIGSIPADAREAVRQGAAAELAQGRRRGRGARRGPQRRTQAAAWHKDGQPQTGQPPPGASGLGGGPAVDAVSAQAGGVSSEPQPAPSTAPRPPGAPTATTGQGKEPSAAAPAPVQGKPQDEQGGGASPHGPGGATPVPRADTRPQAGKSPRRRRWWQRGWAGGGGEPKTPVRAPRKPRPAWAGPPAKAPAPRPHPAPWEPGMPGGRSPRARDAMRAAQARTAPPGRRRRKPGRRAR